jgi:hypothetical protein
MRSLPPRSARSIGDFSSVNGFRFHGHHGKKGARRGATSEEIRGPQLVMVTI